MLVSLIVFLPIIVGFALLFFKNAKLTKIAALGFALAEFILSLALLKNFDASTTALQFVEKTPWISKFGINYFVGVDGISLWLILLTTFLTPIIILASWNSIDKKIQAFHAALLILEAAMLGAFVSIDLILFFSFWELMLVPMFLLVGIWGGDKRIYAAYKFFIYTMLGSIFMLVAIITLMMMTKSQTGVMSASLLDFYKLHIPFAASTFFNPQTLMFFAFALAFAIKVPIFPLHTWLPDAHVQAPTPGSVVLAGVLLKLGTYGFLRFAMPLFPEASAQYTPLFICLAVFGIIYGALVAMVQPDMKKLVAYSSVSHLGYCMLGLFAFNMEGVSGSLYQMLNHGVSTGALFLLVGIIYERTHSREISKYGGLAKAMPLFAIFFFITTLSSIAVPGTNGFVGEFLILLGAFKLNKIAAGISATGMVFGAVYMLWMYKRIFFGPAGELVPHVEEEDHHGHQAAHNHKAAHHAHALTDLSKREIAVLMPLMILIFVMGLFPNLFLDKTKASIEGFLKNQKHVEVGLNQ
jgi:NADH-quinone oxidoreductase subunit M